MSITSSGRKNLHLILFTLPAFLFFAISKLIPAIMGVAYSLTDFNGINPSYRFVGFDNFVEIFTRDADAWNSFFFTLRYVAAILVLMNACALALALMIENCAKGKAAFRTIFYVPNMISMIVGGYMWNFIFTRVLPAVAQKTSISFLDQSWIGDPSYSFIAIIAVALWGGTGYLMIIYIAALQAVPKTLEEAAIVDGASWWSRFANVTVPMIMQSFTICVFVTLNNAFQVFDVVYALTGGGPGRSTQVISINIYDEAFSRNNRFGYATAKSTVLFVIILCITLVQITVMKRKESEQ